MYFRQLLHEEASCASYLVGCPSQGICAVVDPQGDPRRYITLAEENGMEVGLVVDSHVHADHLSSALELAGQTGAGLCLGQGAGVGFEHRPLLDGQVLEVGNRRLRVLHTPGHTPEHVCLLVDDWFLLTGDTLFVGDVGRVDLSLEEGPPPDLEQRARRLRRSLDRLLQLPDWTEVYPGHYAGSACGRAMDGKTVSTIGRERRANRPLTLPEDEFIAFQTDRLPPLPANFQEIKSRNLGPGA